MTRRHPNGGSISTVDRTIAMLGACLVIPLVVMGCGGGAGHDWHDPAPLPRYHDVTIILNVSDLDGDALGEVTVWVNGSAQGGKTSWTHVRLDEEYPQEWRGFRANWIKPGFTVATYDYNDVATIDVMVTKRGYVPQTTIFDIDASLPAEVYARDTFVMEPSAFPTTAQEPEPKKKAQPGEVIGWTKQTTTSVVPPGQKVVAAPIALEVSAG